MKRLALTLVVVAATAVAAMAHASPFAGTWKMNVEKSRFTGDTFTLTKTAKGYHYSNGSTVAYDFAADGKDYPVLADRTVAWTSAGKNAWNSTMKAGGKVLNKGHRVLSADGKTLTVSITTNRPDGTTSEEHDTYQRVSGGPGLAGKWKDVKSKSTTETMTIATPAAGKFEIDNTNFKSTTSGSTDGSVADVKGPNTAPGLIARYKAMGAAKWSYTLGLKDKIYIKGVMAVSADGKTLTDTSWVPGKEAEKAVAVYDKQ